VRTGGAGAKGISLLLVPRQDGVETKLIKTTYSTAAGTSLVLMRDVPVSPANLIGKENQGFLPIMYNFNHERWMIVQGVLGCACGAVSDCFSWARQRKVFGKKLIDEPVIRYKLAEATSQLSALYAMTEQVTYDMCQAGTMSDRMGGVIGLLKMHTTKVGWQIADNCVQIMGGRGITKTGMGRRVENFKNFVKYGAVYGGSEEILANLAIKQMMKRVPDSFAAKL
jgi:alkylation response protein AidB-like acyl-CoA dehydrogenase